LTTLNRVERRLKRDKKMRLNFRQISALATSALMIGMTAGVAAAANYPAPFVSGGTADVAIVYGTGAGVSALDAVQAGNLATNLQSFMTGTSGGTTTSTSGETVSLDTSADRIWLNTSLNSVKATLTDSDLPTVLADNSFAGDQTATLTPTIKLIAGGAGGGDNTGRVIFSKQPESTNDPQIVVSMGNNQTQYPLYNASVTFSKAINFTDAESEGEEITLFGQDFTVAADTSGTALVLLKQAERVSLTSDAPTATVTVAGVTYTVELVSSSDTAATIKVTDSSGASSSKEINEAASKRVQGVDVAVITADETNLKLSATVVVGSEKITITEGATVTQGESDDPIDGTFGYLTGSTEATTEIAVAVFRPDTSEDAIAPGNSFVDPVFGSFKVDFAGLSSALDDANRDMITVQNSGDKAMSLTMTDQDGNSGTFEFAYNTTYATGQAHTPVYKPATWRLADDANFSIYVHEGANLSEDEYVILGNEDYGHLLQVSDIHNDTSATFGNDRAKFQDVLSGTTYDTVFTASGVGTLTIDGKQYTVLLPQGDGTTVTVKYPTSDSATTSTFVFYPTIETKQGALVQLYEPLNFSLAAINGTAVASTIINLPDGDGYTAATFTYLGIAGGYANWSVTGAGTSVLSNVTGNYTNLTAGTLVYNISMHERENWTMVRLYDPESQAEIDQPALVVIEGKDDNSDYHHVVVDLETAPAGTSTDGAGINAILMSSDYYQASATLHTDSDVTQDIDWWGTLVSLNADDSDQKTAEISYPRSQVYAQLFVGSSGSTVTPGSTPGGSQQLGDVLVRDSEVGSVSNKNLIVVGGSCINSVAASLVGGAKCGSSWTDTTSVGAGQFLIQSFARDGGKVALLVAGYEASDTVNAATYLRTQTVDTAVGKKYIGTSATTATLQVV
jgi:hypothetical protein